MSPRMDPYESHEHMQGPMGPKGSTADRRRRPSDRRPTATNRLPGGRGWAKSSRVKFEAVQGHQRKDKEVRTEHSRLCTFELQVDHKCCTSCAFECRWLKSAARAVLLCAGASELLNTRVFCKFQPLQHCIILLLVPESYSNLIFNSKYAE